jgi:hypothetical protein
MRVDGGSSNKAVAEAGANGITDVMRQFALKYVTLHPKWCVLRSRSVDDEKGNP